MLPSDHHSTIKLRDLRDKLNNLLHDLRCAKKDIDFLLDQEVLFKDDGLLEYIEARINKADYIIKSMSDYERYMIIEMENPSVSHTAERLHRRDISYSLFHRSIDPDCQAIDIDFVEIRNNNDKDEPVAIMDVKWGLDLKRDFCSKRNVPFCANQYLNIANRLDVPFYMVGYEPRMRYFRVYDIESINPLCFEETKMDKEQYKIFIKSL